MFRLAFHFRLMLLLRLPFSFSPLIADMPMLFSPAAFIAAYTPHHQIDFLRHAFMRAPLSLSLFRFHVVCRATPLAP